MQASLQVRTEKRGCLRTQQDSHLSTSLQERSHQKPTLMAHGPWSSWLQASGLRENTKGKLQSLSRGGEGNRGWGGVEVLVSKQGAGICAGSHTFDGTAAS